MQVISKINHKSLYITCGILALAISNLIFVSHTSADESINYVVNVEPVLKITTSSNKVALDLNPLNHTFDSETMNVGVATNNATGYQLFVSTTNNSTNLDRDASTDGENATMETLPTLAGGYTENTFLANKWGFKITASDTDTSLITANYFPFTLNKNIATNHYSTEGDNTTLDFAAKVDYDQAAGTYKNTLVFTAVATYAAYSIEYYNGYDNTTTIATQSDSYNTSSNIKLNPTYTSGAPTRSTYTLRGWCLGANSSTVPVNTEVTYDMTNKTYSNQATVCNGTEYSTGDTITIDPTAYTTGLKLYAVWTPTTFANAYGNTAMTMQNMTPSICNAVTINQYAKLTDNRDSQEYTIGKLEDGRCWMADNLNFDAYTYKDVISASNTHVENNTVGNTALDRFKNGGGNTSDQYAATAINANSTYVTSNYWAKTYSYSDPLLNIQRACISSSSQCLSPYQSSTVYGADKVIDKYGSDPGQTGSGTATITYNIGPGGYKVGIYYNFCAASLGSYCYGSGSGTSGSPSGNATNADICPSSWRLPVGGSSGEYQALDTALQAKYPSTYRTSTSPYSMQSMLSTPVSGTYNSGTAYRQGVYGSFWSSTYYSSTHMYYMNVSGTGVYPQTNNHRTNGFSVRCIAQS